MITPPYAEILDPRLPADETREEATVMRIQDELIRLRLCPPLAEAADGVMSEHTRNGIAAYQRQHELVEDGKPSDALLLHMMMNRLADPVLVDMGQDLMREAVRGNGVKPDTVWHTGLDGLTLDFEAFCHFTVEPKISEKLLHGRENGEVAGSITDARARVQQTIEKITHNTDVKKFTIEALKKRPERGFAVDGIILNLHTMRKVFVVHEVCTTCSGSGKGLCPQCHGHGMTKCMQCNGTNNMICPICKGRQHISTPKGNKDCTKCHARGEIGCTRCQRRGEIVCTMCKKAGKMPCQACSGTGWHSHMVYLDVEAKGRFTYDKDALPPEVPPLIDALGKEMVLDRHADVQINESKQREEELNKISRPEEYIIPYHVRLPWGRTGFTLKDKIIEGHLFGFRPSLVLMPPFLEEMTARALRELNQAAHAGGDVAAKLQEASRCRLAGEVILSAARHTPKKALDAMLTRYPFGIKKETMQQALLDADLALKRVTKTPRLIGLGIGLALAAGLYAAYYLGPGRTMLDARIDDARVLSAIDLLLVITGGTLTTMSIRYTAVSALRRALGRLAKGKKNRLMPKAGQSALWGYAGGLALYLLIVEFTVMQGAAAPDWFTFIKDKLGL